MQRRASSTRGEADWPDDRCMRTYPLGIDATGYRQRTLTDRLGANGRGSFRDTHNKALLPTGQPPFPNAGPTVRYQCAVRSRGWNSVVSQEANLVTT